MSAFSKDIERAALDWLMQVNDPGFEAWNAWDAWMAADPAHAAAYWSLAEREADAVEALRSAPARPVRRASGFRSTRGGFSMPRRGAIAAAVAVVALGGAAIFWNTRPQPWSVETRPGEQRTIALADGSKVHLAGGTRLALDRSKPREAILEDGRALFEVVHDDRSPFTVEVGDATLTDLGTTFDVTRLEDGARVAVAEGIVRVDQGSASATLNAGDGVLVGPRGLERRTVSPEDATGWRQGRLSYTGETLAVVAEDLARALDRPITVAPALSDRRFSGSLSTERTPVDQKARLSRLLGVTIVEDGDGWRLEP
ncbi:FecR family protein [uncultured Brevundimonas sp.]|uniref:FecR family protein n=1 Tax=uncultured Brevundimonas sp. TaxID=213418 RepID=UPI0026214D2A|nr:FecR domain-containing protein [uncultured Brevundimonas sp.]